MNWELFLGATIAGVIFALGGFLWKQFPPKKINYLYGYRTRRSMANQEIWDYSNRIGAKMFSYLGIILFFIGLGSYFLFPKNAPIVSMFAMLIGIGIGIFWCETKLNKRFDKNGNPKK